MLDDKTIKDFHEWGVDPPTVISHGSDEEIHARMQQLLPNSWKLKGNQLIGETAMGTLVQTIPTNKILVGTDPKGFPIFKDVVL
jgi:hypothetical protein